MTIKINKGAIMKFPSIDMHEKIKDNGILRETSKSKLDIFIHNTMLNYWISTVLKRRLFWKRIYTLGIKRHDWLIQFHLDLARISYGAVPYYLRALHPDNASELLELFGDVLIDLGYPKKYVSELMKR